MNSLEMVERVLREAKRPLTCHELWQFAVKKGYEREVGYKGRTPENTMASQLYHSGKDPDSLFVQLRSRPAYFWLKNEAVPSEWEKEREKEDRQPGKEGPAEEKGEHFNERNLHPLLTYFAERRLRPGITIRTKTIRHETSRKAGWNQWLHPDLVGVSFPTDWDTKVHSLAEATRASTALLYSFEMKRRLDYQNLLQSFFEAVSNSSWANYGYLAAVLIEKEPDFREDLRRLSSAHGIGIIELNAGTPDDSEVLFEARWNREVDWETINKLVSTSNANNEDFRQFVERVTKDLKNSELSDTGGIYDRIPSPDELSAIATEWKKAEGV